MCHRSRHCLPVRPGRCAARTDHLRVPWPSIARSRSSSSAGDQAPLTCVGCVVWGGSVPGGAPKKCRGRRRSQRARECGSPRRAVRRVCWGRGLSRPRDSWRVRDLTGGGVWKERRAGQKAAPPAPAALRSRRRAVCAAARLAGARSGWCQFRRCETRSGTADAGRDHDCGAVRRDISLRCPLPLSHSVQNRAARPSCCQASQPYNEFLPRTQRRRTEVSPPFPRPSALKGTSPGCL